MYLPDKLAQEVRDRLAQAYSEVEADFYKALEAGEEDAQRFLQKTMNRYDRTLLKLESAMNEQEVPL